MIHIFLMNPRRYWSYVLFLSIFSSFSRFIDLLNARQRLLFPFCRQFHMKYRLFATFKDLTELLSLLHSYMMILDGIFVIQSKLILATQIQKCNTIKTE